LLKTTAAPKKLDGFNVGKLVAVRKKIRKSYLMIISLATCTHLKPRSLQFEQAGFGPVTGIVMSFRSQRTLKKFKQKMKKKKLKTKYLRRRHALHALNCRRLDFAPPRRG
jgi:hypothetical protein